MRLETKAALWDALSASQDIQQFTSRLYGPDDYERNKMAQAAVERKFEIIGEALSRAKRLDPNSMEREPYIRRFIDLGGIISRGSEGASSTTIWETVEFYLPILIELLRHLIESD